MYRMRNFHGNQPPRQNAGYMARNHLVNSYQNYSTTNVPFNNNPMLMNNPMFFGSIQDPAFCQRWQMSKIDQLKKAKNINDLNVTHDQLIKYVICPMKAEKLDKEVAIRLFNERDSTYDHSKQDLGKTASKILEQWWNSRTNMPYKNILKNENYKKDFKTVDDLMVYKVTALDKDKIKLKKEYKKLKKMLETHNSELKVIYSASKEAKYKEDFDYVQKYKYRLKYDPKNFDDLKKFYKKEQKKIVQDTKRIDDMIETFLENADLSQDDMKNEWDELEKLKEMDKLEDETAIEDPIEKLEAELKKQLKAELGKKEYDKLIKELECDPELIDEQPKKVSKVKVKTIELNNDTNKEPARKKVSVKSKPIEPVIGVLDDDLLEKYNNRKSKPKST